MDNRRKLTHIERIILRAIDNSVTGYVTLNRLKELTKMNDRKIKRCIEDLRKSHRIPILSKRSYGYFIPCSEMERQNGLAVYEKQIKTELETIAILRQADLTAWKNKLERV